jgi:ubiquinone/menaquinone biosynthesis C-methylase UbiE
MLNHSFPRALVTEETKRYVLPPSVAELVYSANSGHDSGPELRLQEVYRDEIWNKMQSLGLGPEWWKGKTVLDLCCGTGFLSYHLLARAEPESVTLLDISKQEVEEARKLVTSTYGNRRTNFVCANALQTTLASASFDVVIGNSFLHHFPDVGMAVREVGRLVKAGGQFVSLHEPKPGAIAFESRNPVNWLRYIRYGAGLVDRLRPSGSTIAPSQGVDVWLFDTEELRELLEQAGFESVRIEQWNFIRPLLVAAASLHLDAGNPQLGFAGRTLLSLAVATDARVRRLLPSACFSSIAFSAQRPHE